jgi:hypothetical protein
MSNTYPNPKPSGYLVRALAAFARSLRRSVMQFRSIEGAMLRMPLWRMKKPG